MVLIENMKTEELTSHVSAFQEYCIDVATGKFGHEDYETKRSEFIKLHPSITPYIPKRIYDNRDGSNFWAFIKSVSDKYK